MTRPPRIASAVLRLLIDRDVREAVEGDLAELYVERAEARGRVDATLWYWRETLSFGIRFALDRIRRAARPVQSSDHTASSARHQRNLGWLDAVSADTRFALRLFARKPLGATTVVLVLAIGIAASATAFGALQSAIMRPPPGLPSDAALMILRERVRLREQPFWTRANFAYPTLREIGAMRSVFSSVAAWTEATATIDVDSALTGAAAHVQFVTDGYFSVIGLRPMRGSLLSSSAASTVRQPRLEAVISESMWQDAFARNDVTNRSVMLNGVAVRIVGVAPPQFNGILPSSDDARLTLWLPLSARATILARDGGASAAGLSALASADSTLFQAIGRLTPGASLAQAAAAVRFAGANGIRQMAPQRATNATWIREPLVYDADAVPLQGSTDALEMALGVPSGGRIEALLVTLGTLAMLVLLVVCANVGALAVSGSVDRRAEIAVRLSLGASRARVIRQLLTESVILSACGGALGLALLWGVVVALRQFPVTAFFRPDLGTVAFTMALAVGTGILCGLAPALHATRGDVAAALKDTTSGASQRSRLHRTFVVGQVMATQPLLMFVGLMIGSAMLELKQPLPAGIPERTLRLHVDVASMPGLPAEKARATDRLERRLARAAGVTKVVAEPAPIGLATLSVRDADRGATRAASDPVSSQMRALTPGYFDLIGVPLVRGNDGAASSDTSVSVIIGSDLARRLWGSADPLGRRFTELSARAANRDFVVSGVYDSRYFEKSQPELVFRPVGRIGFGDYLIRTAAPALTLADSVRRIVREELPLGRISLLETVAQSESEAARNARMLNSGLLACGALVLFLSAIGLYGSVALGVRQRRREIGVRIALGARAEQVVGLFYAGGVRLGVIGLALGLPLSVAASNAVDADGGVFGHAVVGVVIAIVVLLVASIATLIPAARAARVSPVISLRSE